MSIECAGACDVYVERLLLTIAEAEMTVADYLTSRQTFAPEKQLFCDHVVKRVQQLATVKTFCLLVKKMREISGGKLAVSDVDDTDES